jgi:hypothetical protein
MQTEVACWEEVGKILAWQDEHRNETGMEDLWAESEASLYMLQWVLCLNYGEFRYIAASHNPQKA